MVWQSHNPYRSSGKLRNIVLKRDNFTCVQCGKPGSQVDHIVNTKSGGQNVLENLQTLCESCHKRKTSREAYEARKANNFARKPSKNRFPTEVHPGLR